MFKGPSTVLSTNVNYGGDSANSALRWVFKPRCQRGACAVLLVSKTGGYEVRLALVGGRYVGQVRRKASYTCDDENIDSNANIRLTPRNSRYLNGEWQVTRLEGIMVSDAIGDSAGCFPIAHERFALTLKRAVR